MRQKSRLGVLANLTLLAAATQSVAQTGKVADRDWLLPNLASRLSFEVTNSGFVASDALATLSIVEARQVAPDFPGRLAFVILKPRSSNQTASFLPFQVDDIDGDGVPDQIEFPVHFRRTKKLMLMFTIPQH